VFLEQMAYFYENKGEKFIGKYQIFDAMLYDMCYTVKCGKIEPQAIRLAA